VASSPSLPDALRARLTALAGRRLSDDGILVIEAKRFRSQVMNRRDAVERLVALLQKAAEPPKPRRKSRPSKATKERRLTAKRQRSETKRRRQTAGRESD
jgi:ribosome-associated protein